jgi:hypothetical protein
LTLAATFTLIGDPAMLRAQSPEPPADAPVQVGPLVLSPAVRLTNAGYDSNVFNTDDNRTSDYLATLIPSVDAWLRLSHARLNARTQFDIYYFKELTELRAVDTDYSARLEVPLNRFIPYIEGAVANTRHRQNLEIDAIAKRRNDSWMAGADVRLSDKLFAGLYSRQSHLEYEPNSLFLDTDLARVLNHTSEAEGIAVRYLMTPYTTLTVEMQRDRDRFDLSRDRDSDGFRIVPTLTFSPLALISGRASIGFQQRKFLTGGQPDFSGTIAFADLNYTLLARTRFTAAARRQLEYSYLVGQYQYVTNELTGSITQRLGDAWDVGGSLGRGHLTYRTPTTPGTPLYPDETILTRSFDVGYNVGRARVGFRVEHRQRLSDGGPLFRAYERLRIGSTVTYVF